MIIETTEFSILISDLMSLTFFQGHSCMRNHNLRCPFSCSFKNQFGWNLIIATTFGFVEAHAKFLLYKQYPRERWHDFMKYTFHIIMCQDACELIWLKLCLMLNTAKLCFLFVVWMILMFIQGHRVTGKLELVQSFCCKVAWSSLHVCDGWLCKGDDCEEVL